MHRVSLDSARVLSLVGSAGRLVGLQEILRAGDLNPGVQNELKRILRELVRSGQLERSGKRFGLPGKKYAQKSGPAWAGKPAAAASGSGAHAKAPAGPKKGAAPKGRFVRQWGEGFVRDEAPTSGKKGGGGKARRSVQPPGPGSRRLVEADAEVVTKPHAKHEKKTEAKRPAVATRGGHLITGVINQHRDGFAFVKPLGTKSGEDIFIPPEEARKALDHDQVIVEVVRERDGRSSGRVIEVKSRTRQLVIGTYVETPEGCFVRPREQELELIRVPKTQLARSGDAVKVRLGIGEKLLGPNSRLSGEVAGSLGAQADHSIEVLSIAFSKGFQDEFPPQVMDEADAYPLGVSEEEATGEHRRDLRQMQLVTIDGEDARDFDDAIYVEPSGSGWRLVVAIADVSHYVREGTELDAEALRRATSVYLPGRVLPMLPERLSNGLCSLKPDEDRLCMVADMVIDSAGTTQKADIYPAVMRSAARCTYTEVHQVLNGEDVPHRLAFAPLFERANALATTLTAMRRKRGAIEFDLPETRVELDEQGLPKGMVRRERWESHRLVEECMLAANEAVARFFRERELPTVNRFHGEPDEDKLATFIGLLGAYGVPVQGDSLSSKELNVILKQLEGHPEQRALNQLALRSMMQAIYSSKNSGHYGLGAEDYLHFTSPIRRYPDLLVHRLLKELWSKKKSKKVKHDAEQQIEKLEALAQQSSERERAAMQVEREVNQLYSCLLMQPHLGEEFNATVAGLSENGFYVEVDELFVDGFVKGESVYPDFELEAATYRLTFGNGRQVKVGQKCRVRLLSVNTKRRQIDFEVVAFDGEQPGRPRERPRGKHESSRAQHPTRGSTHHGHSARGAPAAPRPAPREEPKAGATEEGAPRQFDPRAVLDRLWKERGGRPRPSSSGEERENREKGGSGRGDRPRGDSRNNRRR